MTHDPMMANHAADLRRAFDQSFAEPIQPARDTIAFISARLGETVHAIRMTDIAGLFTGIKITSCPSPVAELRGLAGFRGALTPVYDLAALLGHPMSQARWSVLATGRAIAFAFDGFEDHFLVEPSAIVPEGTSRHCRETVQRADGPCPVIDIPSLAATITARAEALTSHKEQ